MDGFFQAGTILFQSSVKGLTAVNISYEKDAIRMVDGNLPVRTLTAKEIDKSPLKFDVKGLISSMSSFNSTKL